MNASKLLRGNDVLNHLYQPFGVYLPRQYQAGVAGCTGIGVTGIVALVLKGLEVACNKGYTNYFVERAVNFLNGQNLAFIGIISSVTTYGYIAFKEKQYWNNYDKASQIFKQPENMISSSQYTRLKEELGSYLEPGLDKKYTILLDEEKASMENENNKYLNEMLEKILSSNSDFLAIYNEAKNKFSERLLYDWFKQKLNLYNIIKIYAFAKTIKNEWLVSACNRYY